MKPKKKRLLKSIVACAFAASMLFMTGCSSQEDVSKGKIAVIVKSQSVQFWDDIRLGAEDAAAELGYEIAYSAPLEETDVDGQVQLFRAAIDNEEVTAIVIAPSDNGEKLNEVISEADIAGKTVVTIDGAVTSEIVASFIGSDNLAAGNIAARAVLAELPARMGKIAVVSHTQLASTGNDRLQGFLDIIEPACASTAVTETGDPREQTMSVVDIQSCDSDPEKAYQIAKEMIAANPDLSIFYATNEGSAVGVCKAVEELGMAGKIKIIGFDGSDMEQSYIRSGVLTGTVVQNPYTMGYLGVRYADSDNNGEHVSERVDTGVLLVTKANIDNENVQLIMSPSKAE